MNEVQFEDSGSEFTSRRLFGAPVVPGMSRWLIKAGIVKSPLQARLVMIATIIVAFAISAYLLYSTLG